MYSIDCYNKLILERIENELKELYACYYSKNIFRRLYKEKYKKLIDEYEKLYMNNLKVFGELIKEEYVFNNNIS